MNETALLIAATLNAGTVLAIAALGLLLNERAGIVNLGAEGMMLVAAVAGYAAAVHSGSDVLAFAAGAVAGALLATVFGLLAAFGGSLTMASLAVLPILIGLAFDYAIQFHARFAEAARAGASARGSGAERG